MNLFANFAASQAKIPRAGNFSFIPPANSRYHGSLRVPTSLNEIPLRRNQRNESNVEDVLRFSETNNAQFDVNYAGKRAAEKLFAFHPKLRRTAPIPCVQFRRIAA